MTEIDLNNVAASINSENLDPNLSVSCYPTEYDSKSRLVVWHTDDEGVMSIWDIVEFIGSAKALYYRGKSLLRSQVRDLRIRRIASFSHMLQS